MTAVPGEPSPLRLRSSSASRAGTWVVTSINGIGSFDFRAAGSSAAGAVADRLPARIPTQRVKLARITRRIDRATSKAETPIGRTRMGTGHNFEVLAKRSHSSPAAEHKMVDSMRFAQIALARRCGHDVHRRALANGGNFGRATH